MKQAKIQKICVNCNEPFFPDLRNRVRQHREAAKGTASNLTARQLIWLTPSYE